MMLRNTTDDWGSIARSLHWLIAALILLQYGLGWIAADMRVSPQKIEWFVWHKSVGITIFLLVILRIMWRISNPVPKPPAGTTRWQARLAWANHALLYVLLLAVPLTGWVVSDTSRIPFRFFRVLDVPDFLAANRVLSERMGEIHEALTAALLVVAALHVAAALWHHFLRRDDTLSRMWRTRRPTRN